MLAGRLATQKIGVARPNVLEGSVVDTGLLLRASVAPAASRPMRVFAAGGVVSDSNEHRRQDRRRYPLQARIMASRLRSTSSGVVAQEETLMRMAVRPCQVVGPHQQAPSRWMRSITRRVVPASPNETST